MDKGGFTLYGSYLEAPGDFDLISGRATDESVGASRAREGGRESTRTGGGLATAGLMKSRLWSHTETTMLLEDS